MALIYKAISPNNKVYIGKTNNLDRRKIEHLHESKKVYNSKFYNSIKKYGFDNFKWEVIQDDIPEDLLDIVEIYQIAMHNSYYDGLNSTMGGDGGSKSEETKKKMSQSKKCQIPWNKGIARTEEVKEKISNKLKEFFKDKNNHPQTGKVGYWAGKVGPRKVNK